MNLLALSPALKVAAGLAVGIAFAGAVAYGVTTGGRSGETLNFEPGTIGGPATATAFAEKPREPVLPPTPRATVEPPRIVRTAIPGPPGQGLFGDGVTNLPALDTTAWLAYSSSKYGYSFKYPATWKLMESSNEGNRGPTGEPAYPLQFVLVQNSLSDQGKNVAGQNCVGSGCIGPGPKALSFGVAIVSSACNAPGDLVTLDSIVVGGASGSRCVLQAQDLNQLKSRSVFIALPSNGVYSLEISLARGREAGSSDQALLETILSTFLLKPGTP